ncbi:S8 family serine peptidase [Gammaproteobacteria bacterium]|nr:S8 family serine peptidase [Gammaproteobacteria bacterium]MDA9039115.1 S8 family serine peptidase [Gammaproteobacteria bacterium]
MHHKNNKLLFLLTILIAACGGGGGGGGGSSTPPPSPAPTISFSASPISVLLNSTSTFSWSSTNATSCTASGSTQWSGSKATSGTEDVSITISGNTTFTLSCSGAGGSRNASITIEGFRQTDGVVVDGYISGADIFIDENENFIADAQENATTSDNDGKFTIKYANGSLVSIGGTDLDSQTLLDNLLITHKLDGFSDFKAITPVTSVDAFLESADINAALGIDSSINVGVDDPVALKGDGGIYDYLYEKGNQLTVLAYALQNITNDLNTTTETTQDFFKSIAEEVEGEYTETQSKVDIETTDFISKVLTNVEAAKALNLNEADKGNTVTALASVIPIIQVKDDADTTTSLIRFGVSQLQEDIVSLANGSASDELIEDYTQDVINYIATTESISSDNLTPDINSIDDSVGLDEDSIIDIFILNNDSFVAGAPFSISTTLPMNGDIETTNNYITYTPDADYFGDDEFSYTLSQGDKTSSADVNITINSINDAPSIDIASTLTASENQTAITTISISDVDEDELTLTLGGTDASSLNLSAENVLSFKEAPDYETNNSYSIELTLTDGTETVNKTISITINNVNDNEPEFTSEPVFSAAENQKAIGTVIATDADGDEIALTISGEEIVINSEGILSFVNTPDYETKTTYTATVTASDGTYSISQEITVNVDNINEAPVLTSATLFSADENQTAIGSISATDEDGDEITYSISDTSISMDSSTGLMTFVTAPDFETKSIYIATVTVSDGVNETTQDITININDVSMQLFVKTLTGLRFIYTVENIDTIQSIKALIKQSNGYEIDTQVLIRAGKVLEDNRTLSDYGILNEGTIHLSLIPVITSNAQFEVEENQSIIGSVLVYDPDSTEFTYTISGNDIDISTDGVLSFVSPPDYETQSSYTATLTVNDGVNSRTQDITVNVTNVNDNSPVFTSSATFSAAENQTAIDTVTATDADGDDVTFKVSGSELAITSTGVLTFASAPDYETKSSYTATVTATDGTNSTTQDITVNVTDVNDVPVFTSGSIFSAAENQTAIGTVTATDDEGEGVTFTVYGSELAITLAGVLTFASAPDYETKSSYTATVTASDDTNSTSQEITVNITDVNEVPVFTSSATFNAAENQTAIDTVTATDADGDSVTFTVSGSELAITTAGVLTFVSAPDFETKKLYKATVTASDGTNTADQTIKVKVTDANDNSPSFTSSPNFSAAENQTAIGTVTATDADGDTLSYSISGSEITINSSSGVIAFASAPDYETKSTYTATVTASDGVNSTTQDITVNVTDVDENVDTGPVFTSDSSFEVAENQLVIGEVTATDPDGDSISFSTTSTEILIDSLTGNMTFVSSPNFEAKSVYTATILASDGANESSQDITINIINVVEAPEAFDKTIIFRVLPQIQTEQNITLPADGDNLTYIIVSNPSKGTLTLNGNIATYKAFLNYTTSDTDSFTFKVSNGSEESSVATLSIDIMTDPLYKYQWHLENTGQTTFATNAGIADEDLNLNTVISSGYTGAGVTVAVIDSGLEIGHEDLADNIVAGSYDFLDSDTDPTNTIDVSGDHGTSVAGIIAARGWNGLGGRGVAPDASLVGYNLLQNGFGSYQLQSWGINPPVEANVDIYNMSYGNYYPGLSQTFALPDFLDAYYEDALVTATTELRSGKGALYVQSSGNEYSDYATADCGENEFTCVEVIWDNWSTVPYILQVGALNANGQKSSYTTTGAALWVSGFGGETGANESILSNQNLQLPSGIYEPAILTTDQSSCSKGYVSTNVSTRYNEFENSTGNKAINSECNYTSTFGGTSSAAPTVAGVMALIISANPELTWRDVKHIIASTSDQVGTDSDYTYDFQGINQYEWETNSAGYKFHNWFGFGKINAADAVAMALSMQGNNLGTFQTTGFQQEVQDELVISDTETTSATIEITKPENSNNFTEFVRVSIQFNHLVPKSIGLRLVSPDGTEVNIMQPMTNLGTNPANTLFDIGVSGLYGESIEGTWTLYADDYIEDAIEGSLIQWGIEIYGN